MALTDKIMDKFFFSIIIPTHNRKDTLNQSLAALFNQTYSKSDFEIIIIDDGSSDGTEEFVKAIINNSPYVLRYFKKENKGPASARNLGIRNASGNFILFMGDDTLAKQDLLEQHYNWHKKYFSDNIAVLGYITWASDLKITLFRKWLEESGAQFGYPLIEDYLAVPYKFFCSSNISIKKQFLIENGLFNEIFPYAAYEDTELAYRLGKKGLKIVYNKDAIGYHKHNITQKSFMKRSLFAGRSMAILHELHPELKDEIEFIFNFNLRDIKNKIIWFLAPFIGKFIPKKYLHASFGYMSLYYLYQGYIEEKKRFKL